MTADIVNLNQYRKQRKKDAKQDNAAEMRRKHGRTKAEKMGDDKARLDAEKELTGKVIVDDISDTAPAATPDDDNGKPA